MATKRSKKRSKFPTLSKLDLFGYPISLNFNGQGHSFKTASGGLLTLLVVIGLIAYCSNMIRELIVDQNPQFINSFTTTIDLSKVHSHSML